MSHLEGRGDSGMEHNRIGGTRREDQIDLRAGTTVSFIPSYLLLRFLELFVYFRQHVIARSQLDCLDSYARQVYVQALGCVYIAPILLGQAEKCGWRSA